MPALAPTRFLGAAVAALLLAACTAHDPGPSASSPSATSSSTAGHHHEPTPTAEAAEARDAAWETDLGSELWASPVQVGDVIAVGTTSGTLVGLSIDGGEELWSVGIGAAVRGTPAVDGDTLYLVCDHGWVHAVRADGDELWRVGIGSPVAARDDWNNYGPRPVVADGIVYAATPSGTVAALDAATGTKAWSVDLESGISANLAIADGVLHVPTLEGEHVALSAEDGSVVWEARLGNAETTSPLVIGDAVVTGSRAASVVALDAATGEQVWASRMGSSWVESGATALDDGSIVIGSSDYKAVQSLDAADGSQRWYTRVEGWTWGIPAVADGVVYETQTVGGPDPDPAPALYAIDAANGSVLWTASGGDALVFAPEGWEISGAAASPAIAGDLVVVAGLDGVVRAYER